MKAVFLIIGITYLLVAFLMFRKVMPKGKGRWVEDTIIKVYSAVNSRNWEVLSFYADFEDGVSPKEILESGSGKYIPRDLRISVLGNLANATYRLEKRDGKRVVGQRWIISGLRDVDGRWKMIWTGREIF
jgi:hypothetical protein